MEWNTSSSETGMEKYIREQIRIKVSFEIEDKINFSASLIKDMHLVLDISEFDREECQLTLIEWIWKERHLLIEDNYQSELLRDLLFNIIIIFELLPLSIKDITSHGFIQKLRVIRSIIKKHNSSIACRIAGLTAYWAQMVKVVTTETMLRMKRERERLDESDFTCEETDYGSSQCKKKKVTWKVDLVDVIDFCSDVIDNKT